eukprot:SAG11_NODE_2274_length_3591_cov_3.168671_2_plen_76_part_00
MDNMKGSTIDAMSLAIDNAAVMLFCISLAYKESSSESTPPTRLCFALTCGVVGVLQTAGSKLNIATSSTSRWCLC